MYAIVALAESEPAEIQKYFDGTVEVSLLLPFRPYFIVVPVGNG